MNPTQPAVSHVEASGLPLLANRGLRHAFERKPLLYPTAVSLHRRTCPKCKEPLSARDSLSFSDGIVRASCRQEGCGYTVDMFWLPA